METPQLPKISETLFSSGLWECEKCKNHFFFSIGFCEKCNWNIEDSLKLDVELAYTAMETMEEFEKSLKTEDKTYWYYLVWTTKDNTPIDKIYENMCKLYERRETLGIYYMDISYEETDLKTKEKIRPHYNMRLKCNKYLKKHRDLKNYLKYGNIHLESINKFAKRNKMNIDESWDKCGTYINKENSIEIWID